MNELKIKCTCGGNMRVARTKTKGDRVVIRYRKCDRCGQIKVTTERISD